MKTFITLIKSDLAYYVLLNNKQGYGNTGNSVEMLHITQEPMINI